MTTKSPFGGSTDDPRAKQIKFNTGTVKKRSSQQHLRAILATPGSTKRRRRSQRRLPIKGVLMAFRSEPFAFRQQLALQKSRKMPPPSPRHRATTREKQKPIIPFGGLVKNVGLMAWFLERWQSIRQELDAIILKYLSPGFFFQCDTSLLLGGAGKEYRETLLRKQHPFLSDFHQTSSDSLRAKHRICPHHLCFITERFSQAL